MATYYVSPSGDNSDGSTWAKAYQKPETVAALNPAGGPHVVLIGPGTYASYLLFTNANWNSSVVYGVSAAGVTAGCNETNYTSYPAAYGDIVINTTAGKNSLYQTATGLSVSNMDWINSDASYDAFRCAGANFVGRNIRIKNAGRAFMNLSVAGIDLKNILLEGCDGDGADAVAANNPAAGTISYMIMKPSNTKLCAAAVATNKGLKLNTGGNLTFNNCILLGSPSYIVVQQGAGNVVFNNSILYAGYDANYVCQQFNAGTLTLNNCALIVPHWNTTAINTGTVTLNNCLTCPAPTIIRRQRSGYFVLTIDDTDNWDYARQVAEVLKPRGLKATLYVYRTGLDNATWLAGVQALIADGTIEIGCHSYSHSDLALTGNIFTITKAANTYTIDRAAAGGTITLSGGGTVTGFKAKTLATIRTELTALGCTCGALNVHQNDTALGEIMADVTAAASGTAPQYLIDATCATGLFKAEIADAKASIESLLGITLHSFATPYATTSANLNSAVIAAGFDSCRVAGNANFLDSVDTGKILHNSTLTALTDANVILYTRGQCENSAQFGRIFTHLAHTTSEMTIAQWGIMCDEIAKYPEVTCSNMYDAIHTIKTPGTWTTADNRTYTRTWTDQSDYNTLPSSPCRNAGVLIEGLTTDYAGNAVPVGSAPDIGIYEMEANGLVGYRYFPWA